MIFDRQIRRNTIKMLGEKNETLNLARGRLVLMSSFFVLAYIFLAVRAFDLTILNGSAPEGYSAAQQEQTAENILRGDVFDRNGVILATTLSVPSLYADPHLIADPAAAAKGLANIFPDQNYGALLKSLQGNRRFVWIKRGITPEEQAKVLELGEPGLAFQQDQKRIYPHGPLAAHLVGYTSVDNSGLAGIERSFDRFLMEAGALSLSLDVRLQHVLRREVQKAVDDYTAKGGVGIVMDVRSGDIVAAASLPDFDPHQPGAARPEEIFSRITLGTYELGSVFKIFSTAAFLENYNVPMNTTFDASEPLRAGRFMINDYHAEDRILTIPEVFMYSSNIGSALMGQAVGTEKLRDFYTDLGLLTPLEFEISEVTRPLVPNPWREVSTLTASYGHGVSTTPLQVITAVSSIVNGGYLVKPRLVLQEAGADIPINDQNIDARLRVVSADTSSKMRRLMRLVVTDGTGSKADVPGYQLGGKTGTAEKIVDGRYDRKKLISSFVGVFPMDDPRYAIFIAIDEPKGNRKSWGYATGGWVAAPAVARVAQNMASILALPARPLPQDQEISASLKQYVAEKIEGGPDG